MAAKKKVLIIDDDAELTHYLQTLLQDNGYDTAIAENGKIGFAKIKAEKPDLVCLDISMPEESGVRVYRNLREDAALKNIPVVMVTGVTGKGGDPEPFKKFISSRRQVPPPDGFFAKPVDREAFLAKIAALLK
jgi:CheY-like chemotaxis protein